MLLSILIPSYNWDCLPLVQTLLDELPQNAEIIVGNDRSTDPEARKSYQKIACMKHCRVFEPAENLGRSRIINRLFELSTGRWILIMDCDTKPCSPTYLQNYLDATIAHPADVYAGGMTNTAQCPKGCELRWTYESTISQRWTVDYRRRHPFETTTTANIMISREALAQTGFPEEVTQYGYEDIVLLTRLQQRGKTIWHLHNPLIHLDIDTNHGFLRKTRQALRTLHSMPPEIRPQTKMLKAYRRLRHLHLHRVYAFVHILLLPITRRILCSRWVSLRLLQLYKLGYYCCL